MVIDLASWGTIIPLLLFLATILKFAIQSKKNAKLPPGPTRLPLIGNLHLFASSSQPPHQNLTELSKKYGPVMRLQLGQVTNIIVSSASAAEQVLKTRSANFADRPVLTAADILNYNNTNIAFSPHGEYWKHLRKICTMEMLSMKRIQSFRHIREQEFSKLCRWISSNEGSLVNLSEQIEKAILDTVMRAALGRTASELATFMSATKEASELLLRFYIVDLFPPLKVFAKFFRLRDRLEKLHKKCDNILEKVLSDHKAANYVSEKHEDLIDVLLKFNEPGHEMYLTTDNIKAVLQDVLGGGIDTSSQLAIWVMSEMLKHPRVLKKAQDEVRQLYNKKGFVDESDFDNLTYLKMVIKETLRMHPSTPLLLPRVSYEPCEISGYEIPANTGVMVNVWAMGRNSEYWKDADSFIPERYVDNPVDYRGFDFEFIPFGAGRRICPGMSFGIATVEFPVAMFLYHFDWALPDGMTPENMDMMESFGVVIGKKHPLNAIPTVRNPVPVI